MKKIIILALAIIWLQPTAFAFGKKETMDAVMNSWIGENINTVIRYWGYPTRQTNISGNSAYTWEVTETGVGGGGYIPEFNMSMPVFSVKWICTRTLEVDNNYNVIRWDWNGNYCPATHMRAKKYINPNRNPW